MKDTQNQRDYRNIPIDKVGIKNLRYPITVRVEAGSWSTERELVVHEAIAWYMTPKVDGKLDEWPTVATMVATVVARSENDLDMQTFEDPEAGRVVGA